MLQARNIKKVYDNGNKAVSVLKGVDLNIERGKFVAITGPSGAGKSTLLHILGGLDMPTEGSVFFEGENINRLDAAAVSKIRNKKIGFVFQFYHLLPEFTVLENVLMPSLISSRCSSVRSSQSKKEALQLLEEMGLAHRTTHFPGQISGGEKQRVAIARALINKPVILFCDEPTGNLDSKAGNDIISLIKKLNLENKMTVVLVTHNSELAKAADSLYRLKDGVLEGGE